MDSFNDLETRYYGGCPSGSYYSRGRCYRNSWYRWGRWVLVGCLIFAALLVFLCCSCFIRRRRRKGSKPMYGTGWMGGKWGGNNNHQNAAEMNNYNQGYPQQGYPQQGYPQGEYQAPPPTYGNQQQPQYTGTTFNPNDGYYGNQQYGGNVQQPPNAYNPEGGYAPPPGPPPGK